MKFLYLHLLIALLGGVGASEIFSQSLIVNEHFNGTQLNPLLWRKHGPHINRDKDLQFFKPENVRVENGMLKLELLHQPDCYNSWRFCDFNNCFPSCTVSPEGVCQGMPVNCQQVIQPSNNHCLCLVPKYYEFSSGMIISQNAYTYGTFEIRCKVPKNCNPAFWLFGDCCEEIDVFEFFDCEEDKFSVTIHECMSTGLCGCQYHEEHDGKPIAEDNWHCHQQKALGPPLSQPVNGPDFSDDFHVWTLIWTPNEIAILLDYELRRKCKRTGSGACNPISGGPGTLFPNNPMNILVDVAASECTPTNETIVMEVDYIKVWDYVPLEDCDGNFMSIDGGFGSKPDKTYHATGSIVSHNEMEIKENKSGKWTAGGLIELNEGFTVNGDFTAEILPCMPKCVFCREIDSTNNSNIALIEDVNHIAEDATKDSLYNGKTVSFLEFAVTPNPSNGVFFIHNPYQFISYVSVTDMLGANILHTTLYNRHHELNITSMPKGVYFVKIISENGGVFVQRIVKE